MALYFEEELGRVVKVLPHMHVACMVAETLASLTCLIGFVEILEHQNHISKLHNLIRRTGVRHASHKDDFVACHLLKKLLASDLKLSFKLEKCSWTLQETLWLDLDFNLSSDKYWISEFEHMA